MSKKPTEIFVNCYATPPGKGREAEPFVRLQDAFDLATDDTTVFVAPGDYTSQGQRCKATPTLRSWGEVKLGVPIVREGRS